MSNALSKIVKESFETKATEYINTIAQLTKTLRQESGTVGNFCIKGRLAEIEPKGEALVIGDLHGDLESLVEILQQSNILERMSKSPESILIFLGDYGDRGACSAETYYTVAQLKLLYPQQVILLRGNHEGPEDLMPSPHDMPEQFKVKLGQKWKQAYAVTRGLFGYLYNALLVHEKYLMIHGGLPKSLETIDELAYAHTLHPKRSLLEEILWSDPHEGVEEVVLSPRGAGCLFGRNVTDRVLTKLNLKFVIRGHEPCEEGYKFNHAGKVLTLFSRKGPPYFNVYGAYLDLTLNEQVETAKELSKYVHKF